MKKTFEPKTIPAALRRETAALHCGVSQSHFDQLVDLGVLPPPRLLGHSIKVWLRTELEAALFDLPMIASVEAATNPCDRLLASNE